MEQRIKLDVTEVRYKCDKCSNGYMKINEIEGSYYNEIQGYTIAHICDECGGRIILNKQYPYKEYTTHANT